MLEIHNVTDIPAYGPARTVVVNRISITPGKSHVFPSVNLPRGRQVSDLTPATSGMLVLEQGEPMPSRIQQARNPKPAPVPEPEGYPGPKELPRVIEEMVASGELIVVGQEPAPLPQATAPSPATVLETVSKFSDLKDVYALLMGKAYRGRRNSAKLREAILSDADEGELRSWAESHDG